MMSFINFVFGFLICVTSQTKAAAEGRAGELALEPTSSQIGTECHCQSNNDEIVIIITTLVLQFL